MSNLASKIGSGNVDPPSVDIVAPPPALDAVSWAFVVKSLAFSPQQARVVCLILQGRQDKEIAAELGLAYATVRTYLDRISIRIGAKSRIGLVVRVFEVARQGVTQASGE